MALPRIEYHLELIAPNGAHGDYGADTPFPAFRVGDVVFMEGFPTGGTLGMPADQEMVIVRIEHHLQYWEKVNGYHFTTALMTEARPRSPRPNS